MNNIILNNYDGPISNFKLLIGLQDNAVILSQFIIIIMLHTFSCDLQYNTIFMFLFQFK